MPKTKADSVNIYQIPIDVMPLNVAVYRREEDNFIFIDFNTMAEKTEKIKKEKLIGKRVTEVFPNIKEFGLFEVLQRVSKTAQSEAFDLKFYEDERISGWRKNEVIKLPNGDIMVMYEDLTKEKQLKERLKEVNDFIDNSQTIVFFWKAEKKWPIEYVSNNITNFGYEPDDFLSDKLCYSDIIHPDDIFRVRQEVENYTKNHNDQFIQVYRIICADGSIRWVDDRTTIERNQDNTVAHYLGTIIDITEEKEMERQLQQSEEKFRAIAENSLMGIFIYTDKFIYVNQALADMSGYTIEEFYKKNPWEIVPLAFQDELKSTVLRRLKGEKFPKRYDDMQVLVKNNLTKIARIMTQTIKYEDGYAGLGTIVDITDIKETQTKLTLLAQAIEQTDELVRITDKDGAITYVNDAFIAHTGYKHSELIGKTCNVIKSGEHDKAFYKELWETILSGKTYSNTLINKKKDHQLYYEEITITPMFNNRHEIQNFVATGKDITPRIEMEKELHKRAITDELTGLYNRRQGNELLDIELNKAQRYKSSFAVLMFDIDNFKNVNDSYGHDKGDDVLQQLSKLILIHTRKSDAFIRWGGEEFLILSTYLSKDEAIKFAEKLRVAIASYNFDINMNITVSIGVSLCKPNDTKKSLLKRVDEALYEAKQSGRNYVKYH